MASSIVLTNSTGARRGLFLTTSLVFSLIMLDPNIVAVSLPTIARSHGATFADIQWVVSAYVLTYAALLLAAGNYADLRGRRRAMLGGLIVFAVSSAVCGAATTPAILNSARAVQGSGGALLLTGSLAILSHSFVGAERTRAVAFWGASLGVALAVGPLVGGIITNHFGWRWIFLINLPACLGLIVATLFVVEESRDPSANQLDLWGILTFGGVTAAFNKNLLVRLNKGLGATFDLAPVEHRALWNVAHSRVEMHLESCVRQEVEVPRAQLTLTFERGERIWTESSYKYDAGAFETLLGRAGFVPITGWIDESRQFLLLLCELSGLIVPERVAIAISPAEEPTHR